MLRHSIISMCYEFGLPVFREGTRENISRWGKYFPPETNELSIDLGHVVKSFVPLLRIFEAAAS